ncbi:MAG TPA: rhodanese-like domain-containing protein [Terriglobales bacterium]|jgi:rhodanese-related sulfurtransferase|nr:rhodanese-like domain-containing protein [Terriglobales bacterium]
MDYEIPADELKIKLTAKEPLTILDVREPWEYAAARIEGSKHIPMGDVPARAHQELDPEEHIVVICHHGVRSLNVAHWLRLQGFEKAQSLQGGIDHWSRTIDSKIPVY